MGDLERPIPMPWRRQVELPVEGCCLSGSSRPLTSGNLLLARAMVHISDEGRVRGCNETPLLARPLQRGGHNELPLLFERFVFTGQELIDKGQRRLWEFVLAVAALPPFRKQAKVAAPEALFSEPPLRQPPANRPCGCSRRRGGYAGQIRSDDGVATIGLPQVGGVGFRQLLRHLGDRAARGENSWRPLTYRSLI